MKTIATLTLFGYHMIEDGKITHPVKGTTLIGNDMALAPGVGTCGNN